MYLNVILVPLVRSTTLVYLVLTTYENKTKQNRSPGGTKQPPRMGFSSNQDSLIPNSIAALSPYLRPQSNPDSEHQLLGFPFGIFIADFETEFLCVPLANLEFLLVDLAGIEFTENHLPQLPEFWDERHVPLHSAGVLILYQLME